MMDPHGPLLITLEVALSGGVLLASADGALRDLAGMRGSYRLIPETEAAIALVIEAVRAIRPPGVRIWLDAPVSNSGRLRERILERAADLDRPIDVELVPDPDRTLVGSGICAPTNTPQALHRRKSAVFVPKR
jgi:hypothetical protein